MGCGSDSAPELAWCASVEIADDGTVTQRVEREPRPFSGDDPSSPPTEEVHGFDDTDDFIFAVLASHLPFITERTRAIQDSVAGGVVPVAGFAALAGLGLVGAAASLWFDRRRREITLLTVRGVSPGGLAIKAILELAAALLVGTVSGVALAYGLVMWLGPSTKVEPGAIGWAGVGRRRPTSAATSP